LAIADEAIELAEAGGALRDAAEAHMWRAGALLELCRLEEADVSIARFRAIAEHVQREQLLVLREGLRSTRAQLEGDWAAAAAAAEELLAWQRRAEARGGTRLATQVHGVAMLTLLGERGELGRLAPSFEQLAREIGALPGWRAVVAWAQVQVGRPELGRAALEELSADGFAAIPRDTNLLPTLAIAAHAIGELGDVRLAAAAEPVLAPFDTSWVVFGAGAGTLGPVAYSLGLLRLLQERWDEAIAAFELALERSERMRARPYVARSRAGLAGALRRRGEPGDAARADELSALAAAEARTLGMSRLQRELAPR
jgi:tetratricopeptide (TPR) repeat protein